MASRLALAQRLIKEMSSDPNGTHIVDHKGWNVRIIPTGIDTIDLASGVGGFPEGRIILLHGREGAGKTTLAWECCAAAQRMGGLPIFLDFERKASLTYAATMGVNVEELVLAWPETIEEGFAFIDKVGRRAREMSVDCPIVIVWDSLHAAEAEEVKKKQMGKRAETAAEIDAEEKKAERAVYKAKAYSPASRAYSHCCQHFVKVAAQHRLTLIAISQVRVKVDSDIWGDHETVGVGKAVNHYATMTLTFDARRRGKSEDRPRGEDITVLFRKNQVAEPFRQAKYSLDYGIGFDRTRATWDAARAIDLIAPPNGKGAWSVFTVDGQEYKVQGLTGYLRLIKKQPGVHSGVRAMIRQHIADLLKDKEEPAEPESPPEEGPGE